MKNKAGGKTEQKASEPGKGASIQDNLIKRLRRRLLPSSSAEADKQVTPPAEQPTGKEKEASEVYAARLRLVQSGDFSGIFYYQRALRIWSILFASLAVDAVLLWFPPVFAVSGAFSGVLDGLALALMAICIVSLKRETLLDAIDNLRTLQGKMLKSTRTSTILVLIFVALTLLDIVLKAGKAGIVPLLATLGFVAIGIPSFMKNFQERLKKSLKLESDLMAWVPYVNRQTLLIDTIPMVCARMIALAGTAKVLTGPADLLHWFLFMGASIGFLLILKPERNHFIIHCPRCAGWTSRALKGKGFCPACEPEKFRHDSKPGPLEAGQSPRPA